ncbi:Hsp70 family protein [Kribbella albertanoniae]|uniref:Hsp70 family protein n=1 Tax=Kribbella albertanoniae TaxID=1266829 RepID=A0A4R4Q9S4_9ACTN|nr:Hsp70 family protein [Kribbella albertanoniae]TDC31733.1 Hsp70 family protein [Kribbella albertanoniae]
MRDTIDFGIDLGTTNSALAVAGDDDVRILKNNDDQSDITPSAVWLPKADTVWVGRRARHRAETDPENVAIEFKLEMGLADASRTFGKAGVTLSAPQLSAEVLKTLRADAARYAGAAPDSVVITVPAAFALNQNKATLEAARLAGFTGSVPLLQEPTAAAFAYGFEDADERAYWMVFDFGGGTFDAAVVSKRDGDLRVLNHAGDPYLGGKLIDWAVVERLLAPAAARDLGLKDFRRDNAIWRGNFGRLKQAAEQAKIQLSGRDRAELLLELVVDGSEETFEFTLTAEALDAVAMPYWARAVNLCREALADSGLGSEKIDRLLLVGGATLAPGLRELLSDPTHGLQIELDTRIDPTTVVARGAAIFAGTMRRPASESVVRAVGEYGVELAYEPSSTTTRPTVAGRLSGPSGEVDWSGHSVVIANPEGRPPFRTGRVTVNRVGAFATEVELDEHRTSRFTIELYDGNGAPLPLAGGTFGITHRDVEFGGARLTHSLGIALADQKFSPLVRKGTAVPTRVREIFRTSHAFNRSDPEAMVRIPVVQGERARADRNRQVGMLQIRPVDIRIDLPAGTEVEVTFEVDESNLVTVVADVPLIQAQFEAEIDLDDVLTPDSDVLADELADVERRIADAGRTAATSPEVEQRLARLQEEGTLATAREQVRAASSDAGAAVTAEDRLREVQAQLDDIDEAAQRPAKERELRDVLAEAEELVEQVGRAADRAELADLRTRAQDAIDRKDIRSIERETEQVVSFLIGLERRQPGFVIRLFNQLALDTSSMRPASEARRLVAAGRSAAARGDEAGLMVICQQLVRLLPQSQQSTVVGLVRS